MISKLLLAANPWHHAEISGLLPTEQERNFQLVDVFGPMVDIVKSPTKADEKALWTVRWKDYIVDPFKAREKGITLISVRDGNKTASSGEEYAVYFGGENQNNNDFMLSTGMTGTIEQIDKWVADLRKKSETDTNNTLDIDTEEGTLCIYYKGDTALMAFPTYGGIVLRYLSYHWYPAKNWDYGEYIITPQQGVRLQVKNTRSCKQFRYYQFSPSARKQSTKKPKCPSCGSTDYSLMPTDFETAKCNDCGKNWDHGIVKGINEPPELGSMSKKASYYIPEGYKTPASLAPEMKWLWTPDNGPYIFPEYRTNNRGLRLMCLHEKFCSENGMPSHGYYFDRIDRGYVIKGNKSIRISVSGASENIDKALEDIVEDIQYSFPDTKGWKFVTSGPDNRILRPGMEENLNENDLSKEDKPDQVDWALFASTRSKELGWTTADEVHPDEVHPGDVLAMSGTFMTVKSITEGDELVFLGKPGQIRRFDPQDKINIYKKGSIKKVRYPRKNVTIADLMKEKELIYKGSGDLTDEDVNSGKSSWFLLPDGSAIGSEDAPHHSEIAAIALDGYHPDDLKNDEEWKTLWTFMDHFDAIRLIMGEDGVNFDLHNVKPTNKQMQAMAILARRKTVYWDTANGSGNGSFGEFQRAILR